MVLFLVQSCTRTYRCDCSASGSTTTIHAKNLEDAERQCDDREFYFEGGGGSGDCWINQ
mgnify:CR=1 FL=1